VTAACDGWDYTTRKVPDAGGIMARARWVLVALFFAAGCGSTPTAPTTDFIALNSISPAAGTSLNAGDRVTFTANVTCTLVSSDGFVVMVVQDQGNRSLNVAGEIQPQATLTKGTNVATLSNTITIPPSGSTVTVVLPLFINGSNRTAALVMRNYTVR
jgi:hypothetical protein